MDKKLKEEINTVLALIFLFMVPLIVTAGVILSEKLVVYLVSVLGPGLPPIPSVITPGTTPETPGGDDTISGTPSKDFKKFSSEEEFKAYLQEVEMSYYYGLDGLGFGGARDVMILEEGAAAPEAASLKEGTAPERISQTTVQVFGIDEPDIVKTDGKEIYFSPEGFYWSWRGGIGWETGGIVPPPEMKGETKIIKAFPPKEMNLDSEIDKTGDLLLSGSNLIIFDTNRIYGYNVSDPKSPEKKWETELKNNTYISTARLFKSKIYLLTQTRIDTFRPCPVEPLLVKGKEMVVKCTDIYHPITPIPADVTFNATILNPESGEMEKNISFVGSSSQSVLYMSEKGLYVAYYYYEDMVDFFVKFFEKEGRDLVPDLLMEKLKKLSTYDLSFTTKLTEFMIIVEQYLNSLDDDERLRIENELENRVADYAELHKRELEKTGIIKIDLADFDILASGSIPGMPLNQFSFDEYQNYLRVATTVGEGFFWGGFSGTRESTNDIYVLDENLKIAGSVKDLGLGERVYSARFIEDKGYIVTFRQIDPFFVIDLSDPKNPQKKGELKIPGYSSYLHPITKDKILGIGKEGSQVKISLFDVTNPQNPKETDKYVLDEYWSDVLNTHHAFLLDKKHNIFFLPGGRGAYVFSYLGDRLSLTRAVSDVRVKRAIYLNDYLYIIGEEKITVLNEIGWEEVNEFEL